MRFSIADVFFFLIMIALLYMFVRPGSPAAAALIAVANAFAATVAAAEGNPPPAAKAT
jgi:hypothetical protein